MLILASMIITGFNGFIGSHLVRSFNNNDSILGISNSNSKKILQKQIKKDIQKITPSDIPKKSIIIHLASISDILYCNKNPKRSFDVNVAGTQKLFDIARMKDCKIVFASSSHVYGQPVKLPLSENSPTLGTSIYSMNKIFGEALCKSYSETYSMDITALRFFSVFGPNSPSHLVTSKIISQFLNSKTVKIGNLIPKRDFIYVSDVVNAIHVVMNNLSKFQLYNVGTGKSHSINDICTMIQDILQIKKPVISSKSAIRKNDIPEIRADISKLKKLGWKPEISLKKGLQMTIPK